VPVAAPTKTVRPVAPPKPKITPKAQSKQVSPTPAKPLDQTKPRSRRRSENVGQHQDKDYSQAVPASGPAPKVLDRASFQMAESTKAQSQMETLVQNDVLGRAIVASNLK
jgi:hypothetical protein